MTAADPAAAAPVTATRPDLPEADGVGAPGGPGVDLRLIAGVEMTVSVRLGSAQVPLRDLLALGAGSVVELDRPVDAPVDVLVNDTVVAQGEIVVVDGEFAVRIVRLVGSG